MEGMNTSAWLLDSLNSAIAREMQVSIQYMLQHAIWNAQESDDSQRAHVKKSKFLGSHSYSWLTGPSLKKIAITEMKHAEAIAERIAQLGEEPTTEPSPITIGKTPREILEIDMAAEAGAIQLYGEIISMAIKESDDITGRLFNKILSDEENHLKVFSSLLENG
jgi:bacterioferritin